MRRVSLLTGLFVLVCAAPAAAQTTVPPPLRVTVKHCSTGDSPLDRSAVFEGSMPREASAVTMSMRFRLYESTDGTDYDRVPVAGFGNWTRSAPNVAGLVYDKHVNQLATGTSYRVVVDFVWHDASGKDVDRERRTSKPCHEPAS